jgi:hypothetical protein
MHTLRESVFKLSNECTSFRPTIMVGIIKMFNATKILDFSFGWTDRLIGAISQDVWYYGCDPNPCLHKNTQKIIDMFVAPENKHKYQLIESPFETAPMPEYTYDLVFTSPPYFILEKYVDDIGKEKQSIEKYTELEDWLNKFLYFSIDKAWTQLQVGGHLILVINNIKNFPNFIKKLILRQTRFYVDKNLSVSKYIGQIGYAERSKTGYRSPQPMWVWKKMSIDETLNPIVVIEDIKIDERKFHIVREDYLIGGINTRFFYQYIINNLNYDYYVYADNFRSNIIVSLSYICKLFDKQLIVFIRKLDKNENREILNNSLKYGHTQFVELEQQEQGEARLLKRIEIAKTHTETLKKEGKKAFFVDFFYAFTNPKIYKDLYLKAWGNNPIPKSIWYCSGTRDLIILFNQVFPNATHNILILGDYDIDKTLEFPKKHNIYRPTEGFYEPAKIMPPFPTEIYFDAKTWQFVLRDGKDGDYVINRSRDYFV